VKEEDRHKQSEQSSDQVKFVNVTTRVDSDYCSFFQENKSYDVKRPFALILCLPVAVPSVYLSRTSHCEQFHMYHGRGKTMPQAGLVCENLFIDAPDHPGASSSSSLQ
jgi:hypothetical protein